MKPWLLIVAILLAATSTLAAEYPRPLSSPEGWGYGNSAGVFSIPPQFQYANPFDKHGWAQVKLKNGKEGYIDVNGKFVIQPMFDWMAPLVRGGLTLVYNEIRQPHYERRYGFVDDSGKEIIPATLRSAHPFAENGLAQIAEPTNTGEWRHGFVDATGNIVIPLQFESATSFSSNGLAAVKTQGKWGFINSKGDFVLPPKYAEAPASHDPVFDPNGLAAVKESKWGYINAKGERVGPADLAAVGRFGEQGLAIVGKETSFGDMKLGVLNTKGEYVFQPQFERILGYVNGFARVARDGKWGYIDTHGKIVVKPQFDSYGSDYDENGVAEVNAARLGQPARYGYLNTAGEWAIKPGQYEYASRFERGLSIVRKGSIWGYVDTKGEMVLNGFERAHPFSANGLAAVKQAGKFGYIDRTGRFVIPPQFEDSYQFGAHDLAVAKLEGKWGYIDAKGEFIIAPRFDLAGTFASDGLASVTLNGQRGYIDLKGTYVPTGPRLVSDSMAQTPGRTAFARKDYVRAYSLLLSQAGQGDLAAQTLLGLMYRDGLGRPKDLVNAMKWLQPAAESGFVWAAESIGRIYDDGVLLPRDVSKALDWYAKADLERGRSGRYGELFFHRDSRDPFFAFPERNGEGFDPPNTVATADRAAFTFRLYQRLAETIKLPRSFPKGARVTAELEADADGKVTAVAILANTVAPNAPFSAAYVGAFKEADEAIVDGIRGASPLPKRPYWVPANRKIRVFITEAVLSQLRRSDALPAPVALWGVFSNDIRSELAFLQIRFVCIAWTGCELTTTSNRGTGSFAEAERSVTPSMIEIAAFTQALAYARAHSGDAESNEQHREVARRLQSSLEGNPEVQSCFDVGQIPRTKAVCTASGTRSDASALLLFSKIPAPCGQFCDYLVYPLLKETFYPYAVSR